MSEPTLTLARHIAVFDVESNGLHGDAFAVAGVLCDLAWPARPPLDVFIARAPDPPQVNGWVAEHVLIAMRHVAVTHPTPRAMRDAFWKWYRSLPRDTLVFADCGWPVDTTFLSECIADDPLRSFEGPFPLHDAATLLFAAGYAAKQSRALVAGIGSDPSVTSHDPLSDAKVSARAIIVALQRLRRGRE